MRAVQFPRHGGPDVLELVEGPDPAPGPGEVLVAVHAAGVNFIDTYLRSGLYPVDLPGRCGSEGAGVVIAAGPAADHGPMPAVGDLVAWANVDGSYTDRLVVPVDSLVRVPEGIGADTAAAAMLQGLTALALTRRTIRITPSDVILVHAAAGGVGRLLVQLAAAAGAQVIGTVSTPEKADLVRSAGAAHVIGYDGPDGDFADQAEALVGAHRVAAILDGVGQATFDRGLGLLRPFGVFVSFGNASGAVEPVAPLRLAAAGSVYLTRPRVFDHLAGPKALGDLAAELFTEITTGRLDIRVGATFGLEDAGEAHRLLASRASTGKILLRP